MNASAPEPGYLTGTLPGIGGHIREIPEDFRVEEIPLYAPSGQGDHLYLRVEKTGLGTLEVARILAKTFQVPQQAIGYAGLKDTRAVTVQTFSIHHGQAEQAERLCHPQIRILAISRHGNKLRPGHLAGNRFELTLRHVDRDAQDKAADILAVLQDLGVPNFFGPQRYGVLGNNDQVGLALLKRRWHQALAAIIGDAARIRHPDWRAAAEAFARGDLTECLRRLPPRMRDERSLVEALLRGQKDREALFLIPKQRLRLYLSAFQARLFDRILAMRLATIERVWAGDIAYRHDNGACFRVDDPATEQQRADRFEISATGPLFGRKMLTPTGQSALLEASLLDKFGLSYDDFRPGAGLNLEGDRRPLRVPLDKVEMEAGPGQLRLCFTLPRGSYATSLLREVMKSPLVGVTC
ncbi:MAG: tRNA pseudouridine(13) synthase TruD [Deltaproteobacteria bacterium]|nr:MAG: tRNA pseudouridine(13) synthase TruD [Deltaproteobacteria bacterium]